MDTEYETGNKENGMKNGLGTTRAVTLAVAASAALAGCGQDYSDGFRVGTLQKASKKGIIWRSFEGELVLDGVKSRTKAGVGNGGVSVSSNMTNVWAFSATDDKIMAQLEEAAVSGRSVKLTYRQWFWKPPSQDTGYTIIKVEQIGADPAPPAVLSPPAVTPMAKP
jgi:hypothetical protein